MRDSPQLPTNLSPRRERNDEADRVQVAIHTHCDYKLGDQLIHLNYLRRVAALYPEKRFIHAAPAGLLPELLATVEDVSNIVLVPLQARSPESVDAWKNRKDGFYGHPKRDDWAAFHLEFFETLSADLGLENPIKQAADLLFDYPAIKRGPREKYDFLVINSAPTSGQLLSFFADDFDLLIGSLVKKGYSVITTELSRLGVPCTRPRSVTQIGSLSLGCSYIVGVGTGPMWPTFNIWNTETVKLRLILLERERIFIAPNTQHATNVAQAMTILSGHGLL